MELAAARQRQRQDLRIYIGFTFMLAMLYTKLAQPYCQGLPHSLPDNSSVLQNYPCEAPRPIDRVLYVYRHFFGVYKDMLNMKAPDQWFSFVSVLRLLALVVAAALPPAMYIRVAPFTLIQTLLVPPSFFLWQLASTQQEPSGLALTYVREVPAVAFGLSLLFSPELPVLVASFSAHVLLVAAFTRTAKHKYPHLELQPALHVAISAASFVLALAAHLWWRRQQRSAAHMTATHLAVAHGRKCTTKPDACTSTAISSTAQAGDACCNALDHHQQLDEARDTALQAARRVVSSSRAVPYYSNTSVLSLYLKVDQTEPADLAPDYVDRLAAKAAAAGLVLANAYVRPGCIELVFDVMAPHGVGAGKPGSGAKDHAASELLGMSPESILTLLGLPQTAALRHMLQVQQFAVANAGGIAGRIEQLQPRIVLLQQPQATGGTSDTGQCTMIGAGRSAPEQQATSGRHCTASAGAQPAAATPGPLPLTLLADVLCPESAASLGHPLELLVRHQGTYLPLTARLAGSITGSLQSYELTLTGLPQRPGVLLAECRLAPGAGAARPVLLLDDAIVVSELQQAVAGWLGLPEELDSLLFDLGMWFEQEQRAAAPSNTRGAEGSGRNAAAAAAALRWHHSLGAGLLAYACHCGWRATAQRLARGLRGLGVRLADVAPDRLLPRGSSGLLVRAAASGSARMAAQAAVWACGLGDVQEHVSGMGGAAAAAAARSLPVPVLQAMGVCRTSPEEEEAFQLFSARCIAVPARIIHGVEAVLLVIVCARTSGDGLAMVGNAGALLAVLPSLLAACVCLLVGRVASQKLLRMAGMARQLCYLAAMLVVLVGERLAAPPHSVLQQYSTGPAVVVMEGLVVPASCLVPLPAALFVALVRVPLWAHCYLYLCSGTDMCIPNLWTAYARSLFISSLAVATTLTCQACLRAAFRRRRCGAGSVRPSERGLPKED